jgi:looped-hinge helix DNA binding domain, AbrB family
MKSTGIVRRVDELGRIVLPKELRGTLGIEERTPLEIYTEDDSIILKKHETACVFCGGTEDMTVFRGKQICAVCLSLLQK